MARNAARRHQHRVEADIANALVWISRQPRLGGRGDAAALAVGDGPGGIVEACTGLDLDEHEETAPARDDVDFADR